MCKLINEHQVLPITLYQHHFFDMIKEIEDAGFNVKYGIENGLKNLSYAQVEQLIVENTRAVDFFKRTNIKVGVYEKEDYCFLLATDIAFKFVTAEIPFNYVHEIYKDVFHVSKKSICVSKLPETYIKDVEWDKDCKVDLFRYVFETIDGGTDETLTHLFEYEPDLFKKGRVCAIIRDLEIDLYDTVTSQFLDFTDLE